MDLPYDTSYQTNKSLNDDDDDDDDDADDDADDADDDDDDEDDVMKEMRLCTPWISTPFPPPRKIDFITKTPPLSKTKSIIGPNSAPNTAKAEGTPAGTTQLS